MYQTNDVCNLILPGTRNSPVMITCFESTERQKRLIMLWHRFMSKTKFIYLFVSHL